MLYNLKRDTKKDPKGITWLDIFPDPEGRSMPAVQSGDQILESMRMWAALVNQQQQPS